MNKFEGKDFKNIVSNCTYPKQYFQKFTLIDEIFEDDTKYKDFIYLSALNKLVKDSLVRFNNDKYSLDYEGLMLFTFGGLLKKQISLERKSIYQLLIWKITLIAFIFNLLFQIYNTFLKDDKSRVLNHFISNISNLLHVLF